MLIKPYHAKCENRNIIARVNEISGEPEGWFDPTYMSQRNFYTLSFDFFVNWATNQVPNEIWLKRIVSQNVQWPNLNGQELYRGVCDLDTQLFVNNLRGFCDTNGFYGKYMLFRDLLVNEWSNNPREIVKLDVNSLNTNLYSPSEIEEQIYNLRRQTFNLDGLFWSYSSLECWLSKRPNFWPGDLDNIIVEQNTHRPRAILEYKKHTMRTPLNEQTLMNYRDRDRRKYESLGLFRDRLSDTNNVVKLFIIFYSTDRNVDYIKIEQLDGAYNNLNVINTYYLALPNISNRESIQQYCNAIIQML